MEFPTIVSNVSTRELKRGSSKDMCDLFMMELNTLVNFVTIHHLDKMNLNNTYNQSMMELP